MSLQAPVGDEGKVALCEKAASLLDTVASKEPKESVAVEAVSALEAFVRAAGPAIPAALSDAFKRALTDKKTPQLVRAAYLRCMLQAYRGDSLPEGKMLLEPVVALLGKQTGLAKPEPLYS